MLRRITVADTAGIKNELRSVDKTLEKNKRCVHIFVYIFKQAIKVTDARYLFMLVGEVNENLF